MLHTNYDFVFGSPGKDHGVIIYPWELLQRLHEEQDESHYDNRLHKRQLERRSDKI